MTRGITKRNRRHQWAEQEMVPLGLLLSPCASSPPASPAVQGREGHSWHSPGALVRPTSEPPWPGLTHCQEPSSIPEEDDTPLFQGKPKGWCILEVSKREMSPSYLALEGWEYIGFVFWTNSWGTLSDSMTTCELERVPGNSGCVAMVDAGSRNMNQGLSVLPWWWCPPERSVGTSWVQHHQGPFLSCPEGGIPTGWPNDSRAPKPQAPLWALCPFSAAQLQPQEPLSPGAQDYLSLPPSLSSGVRSAWSPGMTSPWLISSLPVSWEHSKQAGGDNHFRRHRVTPMWSKQQIDLITCLWPVREASQRRCSEEV